MTRRCAVVVPASASRSSLARRVNFDTPSLKGLRLEPFRFQTETCRHDTRYARRKIFAVPFGTATVNAISR